MFLLAFLAIALPACTTERIVVQTKYEYILPPETLYTQTESPGMDDLSTWRKVAARIYEYDEALMKCNADKSSISSYVNSKMEGK